MNRIPLRQFATLRVRLTLWYVLLTGLIIVAFSLWLRAQLAQSVADQLDTSLQFAATQLRSQLDETHQPLRLQPSDQTQAMVRRMLEQGYALRVIAADGTLLESFGAYTILPVWNPVGNSYMSFEHDEASWRGYSQRIESAGGRTQGSLQVFRSREAIEDAVTGLQRPLLVSLPLALLLVALGGLILSQRALEPIARMTRIARSITAKDMTRRINYDGPHDEIGRLAQTFDQMLDRLQAGIERERRLIADTSHELRTPLTTIKGNLGVALSRKRSPEEHEHILRELEGEVDRLVRLSNDLLYLARLDAISIEKSPVDLSALVGAVADQIRPLAQAKGITLAEQIASGLMVQADGDQLIRVFLNLLDNAVKFTPSGGHVAVRTTQDTSHVCVLISDMGIGIPPEHLPHLFERFHRVENARSRPAGGAGLGLAIAYEIVRLHDGTIGVQSTFGRGSTFTVRLPRG